MVQIRKHAIIRRVKDITIGGTLSLALLGGTGVMQGCGGGRDERQETETVYTKGVQTFIEETEKGVFKIADEKTVDPEDSKVFITYLDGRRATLNLEEAQQIVGQREEGNGQGQGYNNGGYYHQSGISSLLLYGGMGYLMGRSLSTPPNPAYYSNPAAYQRSQQNATTLSRSRTTAPTNSRSGYFGRSRGFGSGG
ncbi:MAG: hypothetical protein H7Z75_05495 [Ferruginibacter sp.]|nr:hypothetical protein [Cytophagales bacterium]